MVTNFKIASKKFSKRTGCKFLKKTSEKKRDKSISYYSRFQSCFEIVYSQIQYIGIVDVIAICCSNNCVKKE